MDKNPLEFSTRFRKKLTKARAKLNKEGFEFSDISTQYIVLSNGGLANGIQRNDLEEILTPFLNLTMIPQKSYSLVAFKDVRTAEAIYEKVQGHVLKSSSNLASQNPTLYLHYVKDFNTDKSGNCQPSQWGNVPGLILLEDFITKQEESKLLTFLESENPPSNGIDNSDNVLKHRKVWHYGYEFRYKYSDVDPNLPLKDGIPKILDPVISKMIETGYINKKPNQITINKYEPGQGIPPHIDNPEAFDVNLASLSLNSSTVMDFKNTKTSEHRQVVLRERSLVVFTGDSRYEWSHGICPRKIDLIPVKDGGDDKELTCVNRGMRISITFRRVRDDYKGPSQNPDVGRPMNEQEAATLEEEHVHKVYDEIASHFTSTRDKPWPKVKKFIDDLEPHSTIIDVGCGSGRYLGVRNDVHMIGCDRSENLIEICKEKGFEVFTCDGLNLSLRSGIFDACICIAVIHHYSTYERRRKAIEQLLQLVKDGGKVLISVWALEQEYKRVKSKYLKKIDGSVEGTASTDPNETKHSIHILGIENTEPASKVTANESCLPDIIQPFTDAADPKLSDAVDSTKTPVAKEMSPQSNHISQNIASTAPSNIKTSSDPAATLPNTSKSLPVHKNRTPFQQQDVLVPWHRKTVQTAKEQSQECQNSPKSSKGSYKKDSENTDKPQINGKSRTFHRYYHVFKQGELEKLCESFKNVKVLTSYYDEGNWCVILRKL